MSPARAGLLLATCTLIWGSTWLAITWQLGVVAPEVSVALRFALAALVLAAWCLLRRRPLRFAPRDHLLLAAQGAFMFALSYVLIYHAEQRIVSGLVAVVFATYTFMNVFAERVARGTPVTGRALVASLLGLGGVALLFAPELAGVGTDAGEATLQGVAVALAGTLASTLGAMAAAGLQRRGHPIVPATTWALGYGAAITAAVALALGRPWTLDLRFPYVASLLYLALAGTVAAFLAYLALMRGVGMVRASYVGVTTPVIALALSALFESYRLSAWSFAGLALIAAGNVLIARRAQAPGTGRSPSR